MARGGGGGSHGGGSHGGGFSSHSRSSSSSRSSGSRSGGFSSHSSSARHTGSIRTSGSVRTGRTGAPGGAGGMGGYRRSGGFFPVFLFGSSRASRSGRSAGNGGGGCFTGCLTAILILVILLILGGLISIFDSDKNTQTSGTAVSTVRREKLADRLCETSDRWYQDDWGDWIGDGSTLRSGLQSFYEKTGVQPFVWITGEQGRQLSTEKAVENAASEKYDELYRDNGHLVLVFREYPNDSGNYISTCYAAEDAEQVMDAEAREILLNWIDTCYDDESLSEEAFFAKAFRQAAAQIMSGSTQTAAKESDTSDDWTLVIFLILIAAAIIAVLIGFSRKKNAVAAGTSSPQSQNTPASGGSAQSAGDLWNSASGQESQAGDAEYNGTMICPHCGATVVLGKGKTGTCSYCGSPVSGK